MQQFHRLLAFIFRIDQLTAEAIETPVEYACSVYECVYIGQHHRQVVKSQRPDQFESAIRFEVHQFWQ